MSFRSPEEVPLRIGAVMKVGEFLDERGMFTSGVYEFELDNERVVRKYVMPFVEEYTGRSLILDRKKTPLTLAAGMVTEMYPEITEIYIYLKSSDVAVCLNFEREEEIIGQIYLEHPPALSEHDEKTIKRAIALVGTYKGYKFPDTRPKTE